MVGVVVLEGICEGVFEEESLASVHGHEEFVEVYLAGLILVQLFKIILTAQLKLNSTSCTLMVTTME